jgi:hypothetical protein
LNRDLAHWVLSSKKYLPQFAELSHVLDRPAGQQNADRFLASSVEVNWRPTLDSPDRDRRR